MAKSVDMVSLLRVVVARGVMKWDPHFWMQLMIKESTAHFVKFSGSSAERYQHRLVCSVGSRVVSFLGLMAEVVEGWVFFDK